MPRKYSIIIPYQHLPERLPLFYACITNLAALTNGIEICIHEVGEKKHLQLGSTFKHLFTKYSGIFHRAWAINRGVRELSTGDMLILMDGDLIVNSKWVKAVLSCTEPAVGWNRLHLLDENGTAKYLKTQYVDKTLVKKSKTPAMGSAAGGITIVPRKTFFSLKGIPEEFSGSWGGEDNVFWAKSVKLGGKFKSIKSEVFHLDHSASTPRVMDIQRQALAMIHWNESQWTRHSGLVGDSWGAKSADMYRRPSYECVSSSSETRLTLAMLSWIRPVRLVKTLRDLYETLTIPINLVLMVQGEEDLTEGHRKAIHQAAHKFAGVDLFYTKGNIGTGPARNALAKRALNRFYTPYINFADDDTTYTKGSVEAALDLLDNDGSLGVVGVRFKINAHRLDSHMYPTRVNTFELTKPIEYVDTTGSASAFMRREVFDLCEVNPRYIIGTWDLDFFLQIRSVGWRIANYEAFEGMCALNNWEGSKKYRAARANKKKIFEGQSFFRSKWLLEGRI